MLTREIKTKNDKEVISHIMARLSKLEDLVIFNKEFSRGRNCYLPQEVDRIQKEVDRLISYKGEYIR